MQTHLQIVRIFTRSIRKRKMFLLLLYFKLLLKVFFNIHLQICAFSSSCYIIYFEITLFKTKYLHFSFIFMFFSSLTIKVFSTQIFTHVILWVLMIFPIFHFYIFCLNYIIVPYFIRNDYSNSFVRIHEIYISFAYVIK